ncbi:DUF2024 family protein [Thalassotalea ganghwensis]
MTAQTEALKVHVFDTHVTTQCGNYYHFDVLVSDQNVKRATEFAERYMQQIGLADAEVVQKRCNFCHSETANHEVQKEIIKTGYYIIPMQGCPKALV